jgi:hypothetical protein
VCEDYGSSEDVAKGELIMNDACTRVPGASGRRALLAVALASALASALATALATGLATGLGTRLVVAPWAGPAASTGPKPSPMQTGRLHPASLQQRRVVTAGDTINGSLITDPDIIDRINHVATRIPAAMLARHYRTPGVRYLAQAFSAGDDTAVSYGLFRDPAAALAFGCALDADLSLPCEITPAGPMQSAYEDAPGVTCVPMGIALGAPAYEPDRCEASR